MKAYCAAYLSVGLATMLAGFTPLSAEAAGGTSHVASKGRKVSEQAHWPKGVEALLNLPFRSDGWNSWFTEWPNDVEHYQLEVKTTADANSVLTAFGKIKSDQLHVRLSLGKEPASIGWVSKIKEGNGTAILFSIGNQARLDQWFARLEGGKFGAMEFDRCPTAVPPTLTIFVENDAIDLDKLMIPGGIAVEAGGVPALFHESNLKADPTKPVAPAKPRELDANTKKVMERIERYLEKRRKVS